MDEGSGSRSGKYHTDGESSMSESEYQHALEVVFDEDNARRRKSSLVSSEKPSLAQQAAKKRETTSCFVHQLLGKTKPRKGQPALAYNEDRSLDKTSESQNHNVHSRLLTKRQLSEMAIGVRELSKKLGSIRLKLKVKSIFLLTKAHDSDLIKLTRNIAEWLLSTERGTEYSVYVENTLEHNRMFDAQGLVAQDPSFQGRLKYWDNDLCRRHPHLFDFAVTLGGDGTLLYASWLFQNIVPPVLSFALGSLGFLTKFDYADYRETLSTAFNDGITVSLRLRFEATIMRTQTAHGDGKHDLVEELIGDEAENNLTHKPDGSYNILNEIVVDRGPNPTMSSTELFMDGKFMTSVQADGVCVATPTGSTAYNLAAGGSLCHPENPVILVTAICAHTLSFRPVILPDTIVLRVGVPYDARTSSWASFDGRERVELHPGDYVTISASRYPFANVMPQGSNSEDWIGSISRTLNWNSRQKQKSFKEWEQQSLDKDSETLKK
ncbi:MAG: hypothetical protein LQ345_001206 [Seirophora villosa]|nr:MAG: hypothetical protein LQ345_001206 [Seirophora villosa]